MNAKMALRKAEAAGHAIETCDRCGGRFPGIGVRINDRVYCCDKCAEGPQQMMPRMLLMSVVLLSVGAALGWSISRGIDIRA